MDIEHPQHPPSYGSSDFEDFDEVLPSFPPPPSYTRPSSVRRRRHRDRTGTEHTFILKDTREQPWARLRLHSWAGSAKQTPMYRPGDDVCGFLDLQLNKGKAIQSINVVIRGYVNVADNSNNSNHYGNSMADTGHLFLEMKSTLWKPSMGDPRSSFFSSADGAAVSSSPSQRRPHTRSYSLAAKEFKERLTGEYTFPFRFQLPPVTTNNDGSISSSSEALPPSFHDTKMPVNVTYELEAMIQTAIFKSDATIKTEVEVTPTARPPLPSPSRELIYTCQSDIVPPGPLEDPEGWEVLDPAVCSGMLFNSMNFGLNCTMALANPLIYSRGYSIPIHLTLTRHPSFDTSLQSLDLLSDPSGIRIGLMRTVTVNGDAMKESLKRKTSKSSPRQFTSCVAMGVCWPNTSEPQLQGRKSVNCEIKLRKELTPSFEYRGLKLEYSVVLLPFQTIGVTSIKKDHLADVPVQLVAGRPQGSAKPISCVPSGYKAPSLVKFGSVDEDDFLFLFATDLISQGPR